MDSKKMQDRIELFENAPIPKMVISFSLPMMLGMLVNVAYNLADTFFIGQTGDPNQVTAVTICMPLFMLCMAIGNIFGIGSASYISRLLGKREYPKAKNVSAFAFYGSLIVGTLYAVAMFIFMDKILWLVGASDNTFKFAKEYLIIIAIGTPFHVSGFVMSQLVRSEGAAKQAMIGMAIGTVINCALDPLFISGFAMGVKGAAVATSASQIVTFIYFIIHFTKKSDVLSLYPRDLKPNGETAKQVFSIGLPASLNGLLMSSAGIIFNNFAGSYGDNVIAALGVTDKIISLPVMLVIGLSQGLQPVFGYNYAAGLHKRMKSTLKFALTVSIIFSSAIALCIFAFGGTLVKWFINDTEVIALGGEFIRKMCWPMPFLCVLFLSTNTFQALGKPLRSLVMSIARQGLAFIPSVIILNHFFGRDGIVFAQPIADIVSSIVAASLVIPLLRTLSNEDRRTEPEPVLDDPQPAAAEGT